MATSTRPPAYGSNSVAVGTIAWSGTGNVLADDGSVASLELEIGETSNYLIAFGFGFTIPSDATINGLTATIRRKATSGMPVDDYSVRLVLAGAAIGSDYASAVDWPAAEAAETYGGAADLWGLTLTPAIVNDSSFGIAIAAGFIAATAALEVDYIEITITYTAATVPDYVHAEQSAPEWDDDGAGDWFAAIVQVASSVPPVDALDWIVLCDATEWYQFEELAGDWYGEFPFGYDSAPVDCVCEGALVLVSATFGTIALVGSTDDDGEQLPPTYGTLELVSVGCGTLVKTLDCIC